MEKIKCECGHVNPHGTVLCGSCGRTLTEEATKQTMVDMRYEGSARRSQTYKRTFIDKTWSFFSSVKVGVWLIITTLIVSALGTVFPQEAYIPPGVIPEQFYSDQYGILGELFVFFDFHRLYEQWWYLVLIASIGISLVIASLDRFVPLYRALKTQRIDRHEGFLKRQRLYAKTEASPQDEVTLQTVKTRLQARRYRVTEKDGSLLAEKGRFTRWGPYVNHIGLIIFLLGAMLRFVPGMYVDTGLFIREGETKAVPGTDGQYYIENLDFSVEMYDARVDGEQFATALENQGAIVKQFRTEAVLYERVDERLPGQEVELEKVKEHDIIVNEPLQFDGFSAYQVDYRLDELQRMNFQLESIETGESFGEIEVNLNNPETNYDLGNGYMVELVNYYPDFELEDGVPSTKTSSPNNPAFVFRMVAPDKEAGEISFVAIQQNLDPTGENEYKMTFSGIDTTDVTGLTIRKDRTLWVLGIGGIIFMVGVIQGAYWNHRRLWIVRKDGVVHVAAHTNKNWFGLKREIDGLLENVPWPPLEDKNAPPSEEKSSTSMENTNSRNRNEEG